MSEAPPILGQLVSALRRELGASGVLLVVLQKGRLSDVLIEADTETELNVGHHLRDVGKRIDDWRKKNEAKEISKLLQKVAEDPASKAFWAMEERAFNDLETDLFTLILGISVIHGTPTSRIKYFCDFLNLETHQVREALRGLKKSKVIAEGPEGHFRVLPISGWRVPLRTPKPAPAGQQELL